MSIELQELKKISQDLKLLYVEDDEYARQSTKKLLQNFFKHITISVDGQDGLDRFKKEKFDLILSDINMPKLSGLEMVKSIREIDSSIPIILLSANNESSYFLEAIELDIDGYILKPLSYKQFTKTIYKIVKKIEAFSISKNYQKELELEVQKRNEEITHKLHYDSLTGLLSRYSFFQDLRKKNTPVILLVDIDKFKVINEVYGSSIGSDVLKKFSLELSSAIKDEKNSIYRLSADEFAILDMNNYIDTQHYEELISLLLKKLNGIRIEVAGNMISLDITIGLSSAEKNGYESAKIALDYAKKHNKSYMMYSTAIDHRKESSMILKKRDDICLAIDNDRVVAVYQGIVNKKGKVVKYETLMRLVEENTLKLISPAYFLDTAIKTRLYENLSSKVIFQALEILKKSNNTLSINFTYSDIKNKVFIEKLEHCFDEYQDIGKRCIFEITESESIESYDDVKEFIRCFRKYGIQIAIDDFGSGFSNFEYILEIEPDYLKIDGSLIRDIDTDKRAYTLVKAIVQFSHKLGIKVIAEFVHSKTIFEMLHELDVDEYQGYYFHEPREMIL